TSVHASFAIDSSAILRRSPRYAVGAIAVTRQRPRPAIAISCASRRFPATTYEWPIVITRRSAATDTVRLQGHSIGALLHPQRAPLFQRAARDGTPRLPHLRQARGDLAQEPHTAPRIVDLPSAAHPEIQRVSRRQHPREP